MTSVYVVWHLDQEAADEEAHEKLIGVYSTEQRAKDAVARLGAKPGFSDFPERWDIQEYELDETGWETGFARIRAGEYP